MDWLPLPQRELVVGPLRRRGDEPLACTGVYAENMAVGMIEMACQGGLTIWLAVDRIDFGFQSHMSVWGLIQTDTNDSVVKWWWYPLPKTWALA